MRRSTCLLLAGIVLPACQTEVKPSQDWQPSTLSQATQDKVHEALRIYQQCVNDQTRLHLNDKEDSRKVAESILAHCEGKLSAVKAPFDAEKVPDSISNRYLRSKRSLAAQQVMRVVMASQALRSTSEPP